LLELGVDGRFWLYRTDAATLRSVIAQLERLAGGRR
jgi:hypothetical protein